MVLSCTGCSLRGHISTQYVAKKSNIQLLPITNEVQLYLISKANNWNYNNLRPWAPEQVAGLKSSVGEATWAKYEKLEALSKNSFENFPLFIAAVILGTISARNFGQYPYLLPVYHRS